MAIITAWTVQSPNAQAWQATISVHGLVTFTPVGAVLTATPPVYADQLNAAIVHTPSISNAGLVTLTSGADTGQLRAALVDANGAQHIASVVNGVVYYLAPKVSVGDLVTFGLYDQETVQLLVKSIEPGQDLTARLTFVDAAPGVHLASSGAIPPFESHVTLPQKGQEPISQPRIDRIATDETVMLRSTDGSLVPRILVTLHFSSGAAKPAVTLEAQHRLAGSSASWERQMFTAASTVEVSINTVLEGYNYDIRFRSIGEAGQTSDWVTILAVAVIGKTSPPPDVTGLSINGQQLVWLYPDMPPDFDGFRVRVQVGERTSWGDAMPLHDSLVSQTTFVLFRDTGQRTYLVKGVDTSGNESLNPATFFVDYGALQFQNVAELIDFQDQGFPGTFINGSVIGGDAVASSDTLFWKTDGLPFWTNNTAIMWPGTFKDMSYTVTITPPLPWLGGILLLDMVIQSNGYRVEYAQDSGALFWGDASALMWGGETPTSSWGNSWGESWGDSWDSVYGGDLFWSGLPSAFAPWPGQLTGYTRQTYQIRITTAGGNLQGRISQFQAIFDMPDLEETLLNVAIADDATTRLPVTKTFSAILVVSPAPIDDGQVARIRVLDKEPTGPLVLAVDQNGLAVLGFSDFIVKGY